MIDDNPRLLELRRRFQADPASIAFAQLAEECRQAGANDDAVGICRAGLQYHTDCLSARVTLGRALIELSRLDEAEVELNLVLQSAPDNPAANRALAEVFQKRGQLPQALALYRKALELAKYDPDLEHEVQRIENVVAPHAPRVQVRSPTRVDDLFDFDRLLEQLGGRPQPKLDFIAAPDGGTPAASVVPPAELVAQVPLAPDATDPFAFLERQLRDAQEQRPVQPVPGNDELREQHMLDELEDWLSAIVTDRDNRPAA